MKAKSMDQKHAAKLKAEAAPKPSRRNWKPAADGRTKKAYDVQPRLLPWKCQICIEEARQKLFGEEKGRGHLSATEINEHSFDSKDGLQQHAMKHAAEGTRRGEVPTRNRLKRIAAQRAAFGLAP